MAELTFTLLQAVLSAAAEPLVLYELCMEQVGLVCPLKMLGVSFTSVGSHSISALTLVSYRRQAQINSLSSNFWAQWLRGICLFPGGDMPSSGLPFSDLRKASSPGLGMGSCALPYVTTSPFPAFN